MSLTESQLKILDSIKTEQEISGNNVVEGHDLAERTMFDLDMILYLLDTLVEEGYLKSHVRQLNFMGSLEAYLVELTAKGKVSLKNPSEIIHSKPSVTNQIFNLQGAEGVTVISGNYNTATITNNINQHISEIVESIKSLHTFIIDFPEEEREAASIHLSNLEEEIKIQKKRDPKKIKFYLQQLRAIGLIAAAVVAGGVAFTDNVTSIAERLGYSLEVNHPKPPEQLPPSP